MSSETQPVSADRRREARRLVDGEIKLWPESLSFTAVVGRLADVTGEGFRARHGCQALGPGQMVRFERKGAEGRARVVWTRIDGGSVESGFRIVTADPG